MTRPSDLLARYGGEEFVVLLPGTDAHAARQLGDRIRQTIAAGFSGHGDGRAPNCGGLPSLTASIGCSTMIPGEDQQGVEIVRRADEQLYRAKRAGRNRVEPGC